MSPSADSSRASVALRSLRVNTAELLRQPGQRRGITERLEIALFGIDAPDADAQQVDIDLECESTLQGVRVTGSVEVARSGECRRCLAQVDWIESVPTDELYQRELTDADAIEIETDALDLAPLVRDLTALALAAELPLCRPDCAGLCPVCGLDRNDATCTCETEIRDDRWAVLDQLVLDEDPSAADPAESRDPPG